MISAVFFIAASIIYILNVCVPKSDYSGLRQCWRTKIYGYSREPKFHETAFNVLFQVAFFIKNIKSTNKNKS